MRVMDNIDFFRYFFYELSTNIVIKEKFDKIIKNECYNNKPLVAVTTLTTKYDFMNFYHKNPDDCCVIIYKKLKEYAILGIVKNTDGMKNQDLFINREYYDISFQNP